MTEAQSAIRPQTPPDPIQSPTVGHRLWYWPSAVDIAAGMRCLDANQPFDAGVLYVFSDIAVNVMIADHIGNIWPTRDVELRHGDDRGGNGAVMPAKGYCAWMPYQDKKHREESRAIRVPVLDTMPADTKQYAEADLSATRHPGFALTRHPGFGHMEEVELDEAGRNFLNATAGPQDGQEGTALPTAAAGAMNAAIDSVSGAAGTSDKVDPQ